MVNEIICILCLEVTQKLEDNKYFCNICNFEWEYKLNSNSPFPNQLLKLIELYNNNEIEMDVVKLAIDNWINELHFSIEDSKINIQIPIPSVIQKANDYSISSLKKLKSTLESIDLENIKELNTESIIKKDELILKVYNEVSKLLNRINQDKYYLLEQYRKEKIDIENINIDELDYE